MKSNFIEINDDGTLQVTYMDYGNEERVEKKNTRLATSCSKLPQQGVTCRLNRIDYASGSITKSHHDLFRSMCLNNILTALFVDDRGDSWGVELFHPDG